MKKKENGLIPHSFEIMEKILTLPIQGFEKFGKVYDTPNGVMIFKDRGADILAVAHLDSVDKQAFCNISLSERKIYSPWLDDRLGAYIILFLLQKMGITTDILLTEGEESGRSTAQHFQTDEFPVHDRKYNWIVEFDRRGEDVVMYDYGTVELADKLRKHGFEIGIGSFTDICYLGHLKRSAFNVAIGYENYHSGGAWADLDVLDRQINRFVSFYKEYKDEVMEYSGRRYEHRTAYVGYGYDYDTDDYHGWKYAYQGGSTTKNYVKHSITCKWCLGKQIINPQDEDNAYCDDCGVCVIPNSQQFGQKFTWLEAEEEYDDEILNYIQSVPDHILRADFPEEWEEFLVYDGFKTQVSFREWLLMSFSGKLGSICVRCNIEFAAQGKRICTGCDEELAAKNSRNQFYDQLTRADKQKITWREWAKNRDESLAHSLPTYVTLTKGMSLMQKALVTYADVKRYMQNTEG